MPFTRITIDPRLRIPVATVLKMLAAGMTEPEILEDYRIWSWRTSAKYAVNLG